MELSAHIASWGDTANSTNRPIKASFRAAKNNALLKRV